MEYTLIDTIIGPNSHVIKNIDGTVIPLFTINQNDGTISYINDSSNPLTKEYFNWLEKQNQQNT